MKDIPEFEGRYAVTEDGRVWSYKHKKFLKPKIVNGYPSVDLFKNGGGEKCPVSVHRLVALAYLPNPADLPEVNHKDENKLNNNADNLEWCTHKYNMNYGTRTMRAESKKTPEIWEKIRKASVKAHQKIVLCIETGLSYGSITEAAAALNITAGHIGDCCNGKRKTCGGYHWCFYE